MVLMLWKAIIKGSKLRPQCFYRHFIQGTDGIIRSCALGAAVEAVTGKTEAVRIAELFPGNLRISQRCPECTEVYYYLPNLIAHLNDSHRWTREKIALKVVKPIERILP